MGKFGLTDLSWKGLILRQKIVKSLVEIHLTFSLLQRDWRKTDGPKTAQSFLQMKQGYRCV